MRKRMAHLSYDAIFYDIMSVSEREQTKFVHREWRMEIMIAAKAASSTEGANHDLVTVLNKEYQIISVTY